MEREYERLSARHTEPERPRHQEQQQQQRQEEPMLRHDDASKRRRRNPNRHMTLEDHVDYQVPAERDYSPPPGPANLAQALPGPADPLQAEIHRLAEEAARDARLEDQSPPATARPPTPEQQSTEPRRVVTPTTRPGPTRRGTRFQWLKALPLDEDDPPPHTCFRCWKSGHTSARCPAPKPWFHCFNCGRRRVEAHNCPRCATAYTLWEGRPAHEARFGPSATVTRPPQEPERQPAPMEIEGVREQPNQSAAVSQPPSTPPPSATTRRQDEREPTRPPTTPPWTRKSPGGSCAGHRRYHPCGTAEPREPQLYPDRSRCYRKRGTSKHPPQWHRYQPQGPDSPQSQPRHHPTSLRHPSTARLRPA
ncbi:hypothetical protein QAD02_013276 [Eretmocerus hayati]|uniref:Uncharacterized protein n=1 Tax=Eretmocerus hayati TaxID=131215 RepID=A0ACC2P2F1_9HYME|nr:hypothetical protein QAD02_013276 [Eretmocerus hayati]